jgi:hypothetical protein
MEWFLSAGNTLFKRAILSKWESASHLKTAIFLKNNTAGKWHSSACNRCKNRSYGTV